MDVQAALGEFAGTLLPRDLRAELRITGIALAAARTLRFRLDPGMAFERYAEVFLYPDGQLGLGISQRYLPGDSLAFVAGVEVIPGRLGEELRQAVRLANSCSPRDYWRDQHVVHRPLWAAQAAWEQPRAAAVTEALAAARAVETGLVHYVRDGGSYKMCNVNPGPAGRIYSVNASGEWSLHDPPRTYPLEGPPSAPFTGYHNQAVLAARRMLLRAHSRAGMSGDAPAALPVVKFLGHSEVPSAAAVPGEFVVPFRVPDLADGEQVSTRWRLSEPARPTCRGKSRLPDHAKETVMSEQGITASRASVPIEAHWEIGQEVRLAPEPAKLADAARLAQAGFVITCEPGPDDYRYTVHFPGNLGTVRGISGSTLEAAPPLPAIATSHGEISSIEMAEALLIDSTARNRFRKSRDLPSDPVVAKDQAELSAGLARACGLSPVELLRQLEPLIGEQVAGYVRARHPAGSKQAPALAASDLPQRTEVAAAAPPPATAAATASVPKAPRAGSRV